MKPTPRGSAASMGSERRVRAVLSSLVRAERCGEVALKSKPAPMKPGKVSR
jgi:hypothetical protein